MATIQLTDDLGLDANVKLAPFSSLLQYFKQLPSLQLSNIDFSKVGGLTLDQPALTILNSGVSFADSVPIGPDATAISIQAGAHGLLALISRTPAQLSLPDVCADDVEIIDGTCFMAFGVDASVGVSVGPDAGLLQFGIGPGKSISIRNYQSFPLKQGITLLDAVRKTVGDFIIPARAADLASVPEGCVATVTGTGSLKLAGTANLLAVTNPLASATLPAPLPAISVTAGGSAQIGASFQVQCTFQVSVRKLSSGRLQLGWYRRKSSEIAVSATVSESVSVDLGSADLFSTIVKLVSANPVVDLNELQQGGLSAAEMKAIQCAVQAAVARNLELALSTQISSTGSTDAAFLYDIDVAALTPASTTALDEALRGDLSGLHAGALPGITTVQSVWEKARKNGVQLQVNLLGILNFGSISTLVRSGKVLFEPVTGDLVITDGATAERIRSTTLNFGADTQKLRNVMAESFLLTAAYKGSKQQVGGPALSCSHSFFDLENSTSPDRMKRDLRVGDALGLFSAADANLPAGIDDFGRSMIHAATKYDDALASSLFLDPTGAPYPQELYEERGRSAIQLLVSEDDDDAIRRRPAIEDPLWAQMKETGQPGFATLFPGLPAPLLGAITADYSTIMWWSDAMAGAAKRLAAIRSWFNQHGGAAPDDPDFQKLRQDLAAHLAKVAANTTEEFGEPWGLVAMDEVANRTAGATILISGPKLVRMKQRSLPAGG